MPDQENNVNVMTNPGNKRKRREEEAERARKHQENVQTAMEEEEEAVRAGLEEEMNGAPADQTDGPCLQDQEYAVKEERKRKAAEKKESIDAKVPINLLQLTMTLAERLGLTTMQHFVIISAVYLHMKIPLESVILSAGTAWYQRRKEVARMAGTVLRDYSDNIQKTGDLITVHFDTKILKQDFDGIFESKDRLVVVATSTSAKPKKKYQFLACPGNTNIQAGYAFVPFLSHSNYIAALPCRWTCSSCPSCWTCSSCPSRCPTCPRALPRPATI
jgi:hypothetical protein